MTKGITVGEIHIMAGAVWKVTYINIGKKRATLTFICTKKGWDAQMAEVEAETRSQEELEAAEGIYEQVQKDTLHQK